MRVQANQHRVQANQHRVQANQHRVQANQHRVQANLEIATNHPILYHKKGTPAFGVPFAYIFLKTSVAL